MEKCQCFATVSQLMMTISGWSVADRHYYLIRAPYKLGMTTMTMIALIWAPFDLVPRVWSGWHQMINMITIINVLIRSWTWSALHIWWWYVWALILGLTEQRDDSNANLKFICRDPAEVDTLKRSERSQTHLWILWSTHSQRSTLFWIRVRRSCSGCMQYPENSSRWRFSPYWTMINSLAKWQ